MSDPAIQIALMALLVSVIQTFLTLLGVMFAAISAFR